MPIPTEQTYAELQHVFDVFNEQLFDGQLPPCLLTLQRKGRSYGYFSSKRFGNRSGDVTDELAMNPEYFGTVPIIEVLQTLAHEMCHMWQAHFGTPGRARYHNKEWGMKMITIGLMPSSTGKPGGKQTGDSVADYPLPGGRFTRVVNELLTSQFRVSWYDRFPHQQVKDASDNSYAFELEDELPQGATEVATEEDGAAPIEIATAVNSSNRSKYHCACGINLWGKPNLRIICAECNEQFAEIAPAKASATPRPSRDETEDFQPPANSEEDFAFAIASSHNSEFV